MTHPAPSLKEVIQRVTEMFHWLSTEATPAVEEGSGLMAALVNPTQRRAVLLLLTLLDPDRTESMIDKIVPHAASDRDAILVRQVLGRVQWHRLRQLVPPVVDALLDEADDHDYRRYAELLDYLGLFEPLDGLCARARESSDAGIREVAKEYGR